LPAASAALAERTLAEHRRLRVLVEALHRRCDAGTLRDFGDCLVSHVRFEERELFPAIEEVFEVTKEKSSYGYPF